MYLFGHTGGHSVWHTDYEKHWKHWKESKDIVENECVIFPSNTKWQQKLTAEAVCCVRRLASSVAWHQSTLINTSWPTSVVAAEMKWTGDGGGVGGPEYNSSIRFDFPCCSMWWGTWITILRCWSHNLQSFAAILLMCRSPVLTRCYMHLFWKNAAKKRERIAL